MRRRGVHLLYTQDAEVWVCGEGATGLRALPCPNGFAKYRAAVAREVEERVSRLIRNPKTDSDIHPLNPKL
jgi:hypothetical protein